MFRNQYSVVVLQVLLTLISINSVLLKDMKDMNVNELIKLAEEVTLVRSNNVKDEDVTFYLFTRNSTNTQIKTDNSQNNLDSNKKNKILIHGWLENHSRKWYRQLTEEYLENGDFNIIQTDWEHAARAPYISSAQNTKLVGSIIAKFVLNNLTPELVHFIGHSLGAHVAAFAAKKIYKDTGKKVARITGLDPAGPYFRELFISKKNRLNENDAEIVDVIHTDGGFYGYYEPLGTFDIYVNGGTRVQPNCHEGLKVVPVGEFLEETFCSHSKSVFYFIDIINKKKFTCKKCDNWQKYLQGYCSSNEEYNFGAEDINTNMSGLCFVSTANNTIHPVSLPPLISRILNK